jgi:uncharacterized protein (TIGR02246 family)
MFCNDLLAAARRWLGVAAMPVLVACADSPVQESADAAAGAREPVVAAAAGAGPSSRRNREAIEEIVATFDAAWTSGDAATYAAQYAGADFVGPDGAVLSDPAAIVALYEALFAFVFPGTTRSSEIRSLSFLSGTLAVLDIDTRVTGFTELPPGIVPWQPGTLRALEKNILVKRAGAWRITQHQQTLVAPGVEP